MEELVINSKGEYKAVAKRIEELKDAPVDSPEAEELKIITRALVAYERRILRTAPGFNADNPFRVKS
jgi:hypothetical protein